MKDRGRSGLADGLGAFLLVRSNLLKQPTGCRSRANKRTEVNALAVGDLERVDEYGRRVPSTGTKGVVCDVVPPCIGVPYKAVGGIGLTVKVRPVRYGDRRRRRDGGT